MTINIQEPTRVKYYLVKMVDGVDVRRTELNPTDRENKTGRFCGRRGEPGVTPAPEWRKGAKVER